MDKEKYNAYMNDYMKRRYKERRELAFNILGESCAYCGSEEDLQIDHRYWHQKKFEFGKMWNCSLKKFMQELQLCQTLCKSCHIEKSKIDLWDRRENFEVGSNQYGPYPDGRQTF